MNRFLIDFDGVVLDSQAIFDVAMGGNENFYDWNEYLNSIDWTTFYKECKEIDESFLTLRKLQLSGKLEAILSSIHSFEEGYAKTNILRSNGIIVPIIFALPHQLKSVVYPPKNGIVLVDDKESNCYDYESKDGKALVFKPGYKGSSKKIVKSLKELL